MSRLRPDLSGVGESDSSEGERRTDGRSEPNQTNVFSPVVM